jgi:hypothetical protein
MAASRMLATAMRVPGPQHTGEVVECFFSVKRPYCTEVSCCETSAWFVLPQHHSIEIKDYHADSKLSKDPPKDRFVDKLARP